MRSLLLITAHVLSTCHCQSELASFPGRVPRAAFVPTDDECLSRFLRRRGGQPLRVRHAAGAAGSGGRWVTTHTDQNMKTTTKHQHIGTTECIAPRCEMMRPGGFAAYVAHWFRTQSIGSRRVQGNAARCLWPPQHVACHPGGIHGPNGACLHVHSAQSMSSRWCSLKTC